MACTGQRRGERERGGRWPRSAFGRTQVARSERGGLNDGGRAENEQGAQAKRIETGTIKRTTDKLFGKNRDGSVGIEHRVADGSRAGVPKGATSPRDRTL